MCSQYQSRFLYQSGALPGKDNNLSGLLCGIAFSTILTIWSLPQPILHIRGTHKLHSPCSILTDDHGEKGKILI